MDAKDFTRFLWLSYVVMLLCHEWIWMDMNGMLSIIYQYMSIFTLFIYVNTWGQDVKICQWFRSAESLGTVGPSSGQSACNIPHLVQMIKLYKTDNKQGTDASSAKKIEKKMFSLDKNQLFIQEVSDTVAAVAAVAARSFTQLLLPPIGPTAFQCLHVVDSGKWRASLSHWVWLHMLPQL